ncbi:MAG TPA: asparagine synthase (glutamine-hydrolyzing) [Vicinamibacterales bacterium]|jgi:asparagine synthase (glutamine-hydrolysing)
MCGIAGLVQRDAAPIADVSQLAATLDAALAHRGPDGSGCWQSSSGDALLVHRRLSIIDTSAAAAQPMATADGGRQIVYNGEIYNYRELRRDLESDGVRFRTVSDTEVLLQLLVLHGPSALARVRGMFAFALWNSQDRQLLLARDRFGIKPLYVAAHSSRIAFASELGALRAAKLVDPTPSPTAVLAFLSWGSVPPPLAWNSGVEMLDAGSWLEWCQDGRERRGRFADPRAPYASSESSSPNEGEWREHVRAGIAQSVRAHFVSDVPVGVFLSGGIDSGALVSTASSDSVGDLQTFTVTFDDETSEAARANDVAHRFGTTHHELKLEADAVAKELPSVVARLDQPTVDAVNSYFVSRAVQSTRIKAVLSGAGGDELFCGYPSFTRLPAAMTMKRAAGPLWPAIAGVGRVAVPQRLRSRFDHFASTNGNVAEAYRVQRGFFMPAEITEVAGPALLASSTWRRAVAELHAAEQPLFEAAGVERPSASIARLETRVYLQSQILRDLDAMSMAHGLEVRVPFVDHELIGTVWPELGRHRDLRVGKRLLSTSLASPLPDAVVSHPKQGFTLPFDRWMRGDLGPFVQDGLQALAQRRWIRPESSDRIWNDWMRGDAHWSRPWGLSVLGHFLGAHL